MKRWIPFMTADPVVSVVRLSGIIAAGGRPGAGISDQSVAPLLEKAFRRGKPKAVAISINSPGGSPVQSSLIAARIRRLATEKSIPVHVFVEDLAASGGYWLACAGDDIWIDRTSIVGSIGVISASFGLHEFIGRFGIERRVHTAGKSKSFMDPFQPQKPADVKRIKAIQEPIHTAFIDHVKSSRSGKLSTGTDLFTGDVWVGQQALDVGLADGIGHLVPKMKELYGEKTRFAVYGQRRSVLSRFGLSVVGDLAGFAEERALYARYGL
ncbi:MAG: S49 family peptidase [Pseudomonadota bacterium]